MARVKKKILPLLDSESRRQDQVMNRLSDHADDCSNCAWAMTDPERMDALCVVGQAIFDQF